MRFVAKLSSSYCLAFCGTALGLNSSSLQETLLLLGLIIIKDVNALRILIVLGLLANLRDEYVKSSWLANSCYCFPNKFLLIFSE